MADQWELILHHTYSGTPGVIFDHSPTRRSHGKTIGLADNAFRRDGISEGSGCVDFAHGGRIVVESSESWDPLLGFRIEVVCILETTVGSGHQLVDGGTFGVSAIGNGNLRFHYQQVGPSGGGSAGGTGPHANPGQVIPADRWTTVAWQYDGLFAHHFEIDGHVVATFDDPLRPILPPRRITIGSNHDGTGNWPGRIDDVKVWRINPYRIDDEFTARPMDDGVKRCWAEWRRKLNHVMRTEPECGPVTIDLMNTALAGVFEAIFRAGLHQSPELTNLVQRYRQSWAAGRLDQIPSVLSDLNDVLLRSGIYIPDVPAVKALSDDFCAQLVLKQLPVPCDSEWTNMMGGIVFQKPGPLLPKPPEL